MRKALLLAAAFLFGESFSPATYADPSQRRLPEPYGPGEILDETRPSQPARQGKPWARKRKAHR